MITLIKVSVLTDDETLPAELKDRFVALLKEFLDDDPEGYANARITMEWKHSIFPRTYMQTLPAKMGAEHIHGPKPSKKSGKRAASGRSAAAGE